MKFIQLLKASICLIVLLLVSACGIFGDPDVKNVESLIQEIGQVTLDSREAIETAKSAYDSLTQKEKDQVDCFEILSNAKDEYVFLFSKSIYDDVTEAESIIKKYLDDYQDAWHFGIFGDSNDEITVDGLVNEVNINLDELNYAVTELAKEADWEELDIEIIDLLYEDEFNWGLWIIEKVYDYRGDLVEAEGMLSNARKNLKLLEKDYPDYMFYQGLVDYYSKENSYFGFAIDPTGSYNSFTETVSDYEKTLEDLRTQLEFTFGD